MNVTTADFIRNEKAIRYAGRNDPKYFLKMDMEIKKRVEEENNIIEAHSSACPIEKAKSYENASFDIDAHSLKKEKFERFYSFDVMEDIACKIDGIFYSANPGSGFTSQNIKTKRLVKDLKRIGTESAEGAALSASVKGERDIFIIKVPQDPKNTDLTHELFIGLAGTNDFRKEIPNYAFVFGGFRCPPPYIDLETKKVVEWCSVDAERASTSVPYIVYESITPSVSADKYMKDGTPEMFVSCYMQILFALDYGYKHNGFTHYDLHNENVLMRSFKDPLDKGIVQIPYMYNGKSFFVMADAVATIIDYGRSHIEYGGKSYGLHTTDFIEYSTYPDRPFPLYDAYKFLMFMSLSARTYERQDVLDTATAIFRFFNKTDKLSYALDQQWDSRYGLPYSNVTSGSLDELIEYIMVKIDLGEIIRTVPSLDYNVLTCGDVTGYDYANVMKPMGRCSSFGELFNSANLKLQHPKPVDFFEFYDLYSYLVKKGMLAEVSNAFDYKVSRTAFLNEYSSLISQLKDVKTRLKKVIIRPSDILDPSTVVIVSNSYRDIFNTVSLLESLQTYSEVGKFMASLFKDDELTRTLVKNETTIKTYFALLKQVIMNAMLNYRIIRQEIAKPRFRAAAAKDKRLRWYKTNAGDIVALQNTSFTKNLITDEDIESLSSDAAISD